MRRSAKELLLRTAVAVELLPLHAEKKLWSVLPSSGRQHPFMFLLHTSICRKGWSRARVGYAVKTKYY